MCLCGSTRFSEAFRKARLDETMAGRIVLTIGDDTRSNGALSLDPSQKEMLDRLHKQKIDMADEILVLNVGGYIGESTRSEISHAFTNGKRIRYMETPDPNDVLVATHELLPAHPLAHPGDLRPPPTWKPYVHRHTGTHVYARVSDDPRVPMVTEMTSRVMFSEDFTLTDEKLPACLVDANGGGGEAPAAEERSLIDRSAFITSLAPAMSGTPLSQSEIDAIDLSDPKTFWENVRRIRPDLEFKKTVRPSQPGGPGDAGEAPGTAVPSGKVPMRIRCPVCGKEGVAWPNAKDPGVAEIHHEGAGVCLVSFAKLRDEDADASAAATPASTLRWRGHICHRMRRVEIGETDLGDLRACTMCDRIGCWMYAWPS